MLPTFAEINLSYLKFNYINIKKKVKDAKVMAIVKANAYGHGMLECAAALDSLNNCPDYYGVTYIDEAVELRKGNIKKPILVLTPLYEPIVDDFLKYDIIPTIFNKNHFDLIKRRSKGKIIKVHVKIDTGMGRLGVKFDKAVEFIKYLTRQKEIKIDGIFSHFATSDEKDKKFARLQLSRFTKIVDELKSLKINYGLAHIANSGAILDIPESYFDMVRPGISLYGYYPSLETSESVKLKPVMSIISRVSAIIDIKKGESVSYGRKFFAPEDTRVAVVPFGYAGGYMRALSNKSCGIIRGKKYEQAGQVCMDIVMFNIGKDKINVGDKIILLGKQKELEINAWDWAKNANTIVYEIICNMRGQLPRAYIE
jgi:alanine racemase